MLALAALPAVAQELSLDAICATAVVPETLADFDPIEHADNFCALVKYRPNSARKQLDKTVRTARRLENPNRYYFDPLRGDGGHIQLRRPWMDENTERDSQWTVRRRHLATWPGGFTVTHILISDESARNLCTWGTRAYSLSIVEFGAYPALRGEYAENPFTGKSFYLPPSSRNGTMGYGVTLATSSKGRITPDSEYDSWLSITGADAAERLKWVVENMIDNNLPDPFCPQ